MSLTNRRLEVLLKNFPKNTEIKAPDTTNKSGHPAYRQDNFIELLHMLNTLKLDANTFYESTDESINRLIYLVDTCASQDPYSTCQIIIWSRVKGTGLRTINNISSLLISKHLSKKEYAKRFYSLWDKKANKGGVIFRADDMYEIASIAKATSNKLSSAIKKGFKFNLEKLDSYSLLKYKKKIKDLINLTHPNPLLSKALVDTQDTEGNFITIPTLEAIIKNYKVSANTWEVNNAEAGQMVSKALKEGKISQEEAKEIYSKAALSNWKELLENNKLPILAALRNLRSILSQEPDDEVITLLVELITNTKLILEGKILPLQFDIAKDMVVSLNNKQSRIIVKALEDSYLAALPNLSHLLTGNTLVIVDASGSMRWNSITKNKSAQNCIDKAALLGATIAKASNSDLVIFGNKALYLNYSTNDSIFNISDEIKKYDLGGTNLSTAFDLITNDNRKYDRIFIFSDNEVNMGNTYKSYTNYIDKLANPYIYSVDLGANGTDVIRGTKIKSLCGYSMSIFEEISKLEFNAIDHLEEVKKIEL